METTQVMSKYSELIFYAEQILVTCHHLAGRVSTFFDSPLTRLSREVILSLKTAGNGLAWRIFAIPFRQTEIDDDEPLVHADELSTRISSCSAEMVQAIVMVDFTLRNRTGDENEELHAIFASVFLLGNWPAEADSESLRRVHLEDMRRLFEFPNPEDHTASFQAFSDNFLALNQQAFSQLQPRYVHMSGSFATVHKVVDRTSGDTCVIKVFRKVDQENVRQPVLHEIGILELCMHRNLVKLVEAYEVATVPGMMYVVITPWVPVTLDDLINTSDKLRTKKFPWFTAGTGSTLQCVYRLMRGLADGLAYLHGLSIKHKDLKPDNILLQYAADGQRIWPLITDIGSSKTWRRGAATLFINSTYEFLSPEQLRRKESSLKSDIWQLGCCYSWMLTTASGGWKAVEALSNSYQERSCSIAQEDKHFKKALHQVVAYRGRDQSTQYAERGMLNMVVDGMLDLNPSTRLDIGMVRKEMARLQDV